jgi:signal transduction histidine kinase
VVSNIEFLTLLAMNVTILVLAYLDRQKTRSIADLEERASRLEAALYMNGIYLAGPPVGLDDPAPPQQER